ncbi:hypothetical protein [Jidongwangia harbinensis]|uniref:hypothetical protein n=1 Tax=Jidongwangia harbinensis TaxID=2878561 RepID=UPI001CDA3F63|nr:hypothetical protein [Jidongwangia harbinensis]MCA2213381.1 hypothetical protein [Jidongwangia harbinensis]
MRRKRWSIGAGAWIVAAGLTTTLGVAAVNTLSDDFAGSAARPLSDSDVAARLSAAPPPAASASSAASPSPSAAPTSAAPVPARTTAPPAAKSRAFGHRGSSLFASCTGDQAKLLSWSPAQGYTASPIEKGPARTASIRFARSKGASWGRHGGPPAVRVEVTCVGGEPRENVRPEGWGR